MIDVRAPIEFADGAVPWAVNQPILNDDEREKVGIEYATTGPQAASELGHELVSGETRLARIAQWSQFARANPNGCLYCFRGGQRSQIAQQWLADEGIEYPRVDGGYKALRRFLRESLEQSIRDFHFQVLGGRTGVAKTRVINALPDAIDLEGLANHRGSAFGGWPTPRTPLQYFENRLAVEFLSQSRGSRRQVIVEDEGTNIGGVSVPKALVQKMTEAPLVILQASLEQRIEETVQGYITDSLQAHLNARPEHGHRNFHEQLRTSLLRIKKRLGGAVFSQISAQMEQAIERHDRTGSAQSHAPWISMLLTQYYDPMYDYQLQKKADRIVFRGNRSEVLEWFADHTATDERSRQ